jgi:hypothetical protein
MSIPYYIFLFLLIFTPLAFGTVELWSLAIMEALSFAAALLYFCKPQNRALADCATAGLFDQAYIPSYC